LAVFGDLDEGIGAEHAAELCVVEAAVHVDDAAIIEHFVSRVAAIVVLRRAAEGIGIGLAVGDENIGIKRKSRKATKTQRFEMG
jgi:hypothetical protein